ncbi:MAG: hypothetical protein PHI74_07870 [Methanocellales archaeon]|nr:hypothetical protein [Methanocellales archaeon]MDD3292451.1 hypothetical protein [Methanocellales archaeon]MDD5485926.1 hypothetical protein [Methanocellales archaeon]
MRRNMGKYVAMLLCIALVSSVMPASAATDHVKVTKYAANNYSTVESTTTLTMEQMNSTLPVYGDGVTDYLHQGPIFESEWYDTNCPIYEKYANYTTVQYYGDHSDMGDYDIWDTSETMNFKTKGAPMGTDVKDLCELVGGMDLGDEIKIRASDSLARWFNYTNAYNDHGDETLDNRQGPMVLAWYAYDNMSGEGGYNGYYSGIRLVFFANTTTNVTVKVDGGEEERTLHVFGNWDMHECLAPWYRYNYSGTYPSTNGLSVKYVDNLSIYPPHLHDFNDTGDTVGWAFGTQFSSIPTNPSDPSTEFDPTAYANITADDGIFQSAIASKNNNYAAHRFNFSINTSTNSDGPIANIEKLNVTWNGIGTRPSHDGATLYIWNGTGYEPLDSNEDSSEVCLTKEITSDISNYVNSGNVTVLVIQNGKTRPGDTSTLQTDYVSLEVAHHH